MKLKHALRKNCRIKLSLSIRKGKLPSQLSTLISWEPKNGTKKVIVFSEKMLEIQRNNKVLMEKLIDISKGKQSILAANLHQVKSMNNKKRTKNMETIDEENMKLMMRIIKQKPKMTVKDMNNEYECKRKYISMISKSNRATLQVM
jgi:hypothetical protein